MSIVRSQIDQRRALIGGVPTGLYIGGIFQPASDGGGFTVFDPSTADELCDVANGTADDTLRALDSAGSAAAAWAAAAPRVRAEVLRTAFQLMIERSDYLAQLIVAENGKIYADALGEVKYAAEFLRWYSEEAVRVRGEVLTAPAGTNRILVGYRPIGICILVTPWNFPAAMATRKIGPALAAGCTMVLKPASETPLTALAIAQIFEDAGLPAGVLNVLPSRRSREVVRALVTDPRTRKLSFTGSTEVGVELMALASGGVINTSMELGGNAPFVVFDDADLAKALDGAMIAKMRNGGEACTAANRFYVQRGVAPKFIAGLAEQMGRLRMGDGMDPAVELGPMVNLSAQARIASLVDDAVRAGATLVTGGTVPERDGYFYPATLLADVPLDAQILQEEIFGPVAPVVIFDTETEAVALANSTPYGLVSYIYTADISCGLRVGEQIESGMIGLNRGLVSDPAAPFGGMKQSGIGREGGREGILEYLESQYTALEW